MNEELKRIYLLARVSLICIFLVVIAGSVVRMTGSGMGCPDWPKCFGYFIPPTDIEKVTYSAGRSFEKNQMVIYNDTLWVAQSDFIAAEVFDRSKWIKYPKHDYAMFNAAHTWTEYVNRLLTAVLALPTVLLFAMSCFYSFRKKIWTPFLLAGGVMFGIGFVAWLGKLVVDGNLSNGKVTFHMIGSMMIVLFIVSLIAWFNRQHQQALPRPIRWLTIVLLLMGITQIMMGTQVREEIDSLAARIDDRSEWIGMLPPVFLIHRSFSILVVLITGWLYIKNSKLDQPAGWIKKLSFVIMIEVLAGVILSYLSMPKLFQPVHLFFALVMFAISWYGMLVGRKSHAAVQ